MNAVVLCPLKMPDFHITIRVSPCIKSIVRLNNEQNIHSRMKSELSKKKNFFSLPTTHVEEIGFLYSVCQHSTAH